MGRKVPVSFASNSDKRLGRTLTRCFPRPLGVDLGCVSPFDTTDCGRNITLHAHLTLTHDWPTGGGYPERAAVPRSSRPWPEESANMAAGVERRAAHQRRRLNGTGAKP